MNWLGFVSCKNHCKTSDINWDFQRPFDRLLLDHTLRLLLQFISGLTPRVMLSSIVESSLLHEIFSWQVLSRSDNEAAIDTFIFVVGFFVVDNPLWIEFGAAFEFLDHLFFLINDLDVNFELILACHFFRLFQQIQLLGAFVAFSFLAWFMSPGH